MVPVAGLMVACVVTFLAGVLMLILSKGRRRRGGILALGSVGVFLAALIAADFPGADRVAQRSGFESLSDQQAATAAGITDPREWKAKRLEIEAAAAAEAAERLAAEREQAAAAEADRKKAEEALRAQQAKEAEDRRNGVHCLNPSDGSHPEFIRAVKARLRDPDTFQHLETRVIDLDEAGRNIVGMAFRMRDRRSGEMVVGSALGAFSNETCSLLTVEFRE